MLFADAVAGPTGDGATFDNVLLLPYDAASEEVEDPLLADEELDTLLLEDELDPLMDDDILNLLLDDDDELVSLLLLKEVDVDELVEFVVEDVPL